MRLHGATQEALARVDVVEVLEEGEDVLRSCPARCSDLPGEPARKNKQKREGEGKRERGRGRRRRRERGRGGKESEQKWLGRGYLCTAGTEELGYDANQLPE